MKIEYSYKVYKDFPEATEISKSRERTGVILVELSVMCLFLAVLVGLTTSRSVTQWIEAIASALASGGLLWYMLKGYPKRTERLIQKAIQKELQKKDRK